LLVLPDRQMAHELAPLLSEFLPFTRALELREYPTRSRLTEALEQHAANLCLVDAATNPDWAVALLSDLSTLNQKLPIVALHASNNPDFLLRCLRQGATEFLIQPFTREQFSAVMQRIAAVAAGPEGGRGQQAEVICVMPAKGACGASTVACTLACQMRKAGAARVLLADLDPLTGTLSFQLKLKSGYSFMDALTRGGSIDADVWKGLVYSTHGIDALLAPEKPIHGIDELHDVGVILNFARAAYDVVVVDSSGAFGAWNRTLARSCDELLLVATNELASLQAAQRVLDYLSNSRVDRRRIRLVVNRYVKDLGLSKEVIETALHTEIYQIIPSDWEAVQHAEVEGKPVNASTPPGKAIASLAQRLCGKPEQAAKEVKSSNWTGLLSFLNRG
jgi:pilus assembly protein CpaE